MKCLTCGYTKLEAKQVTIGRQVAECSNCLYFLINHERASEGICRRQPPRYGRPDEMGVYPGVGVGWWCGGWDSEMPGQDRNRWRPKR